MKRLVNFFHQCFLVLTRRVLRVARKRLFRRQVLRLLLRILATLFRGGKDICLIHVWNAMQLVFLPVIYAVRSLRSQMITLRSVAPTPTLSLQSRLRFIPPEILRQMESKVSMKSVDNLAEKFKLIFTGEPGQDWMNHVNELERQQASKHQWLPRQFYYALSSTLSGKAKETLARLEKGLEVPRMRDFIPSWFSPSNEEWHALIRNTPPFVDFPSPSPYYFRPPYY